MLPGTRQGGDEMGSPGMRVRLPQPLVPAGRGNRNMRNSPEPPGAASMGLGEGEEEDNPFPGGLRAGRWQGSGRE